MGHEQKIASETISRYENILNMKWFGAYPSPINLTAIKFVHKKYCPIIFYSCPINLDQSKFSKYYLDLSKFI